MFLKYKSPATNTLLMPSLCKTESCAQWKYAILCLYLGDSLIFITDYIYYWHHIFFLLHLAGLGHSIIEVCSTY